MRVGEICSRGVATVAPGASLREAALAMRNAHVGALVVVQQKDGHARPIGIITDRDIVVAAIAVPGARPEGIRVCDVMPGRLLLAREEEGAFDAVRTMQDNGLRRLPVIDAAGNLRGMLTAEDVLRALAGALGGLAQAFRRAGERESAALHRLGGEAQGKP